MDNLCYVEYYYSRAIGIQGLIGNVGGYIGLFLGYSFLQIPDFIIFIVLRAKGWLELIREGGDRNHTKTSKILVHESMSASQSRSKSESNEDWEGNRIYVDNNAHTKLIARIEQLEISAKSTQCTLMSLERNRKGSL